MGKGSGGTRAGSASRGGGTGAAWGEGGRGLMINGIEQETEKAIKINTNVSWNANKPKQVSIWVPKSAIAGKGTLTITNGEGEKKSTQFVNIKDWFTKSLKNKVAFKGYSGKFNPESIGESW